MKFEAEIFRFQKSKRQQTNPEMAVESCRWDEGGGEPSSGQPADGQDEVVH